MDNLSLQRKVFDLIQEKFSRRSEAVEVLTGLLSVGRNAVYRRLRGDSLITIGELHLLIRHFDLPVDAIFYNKDDKIIFSYSFFTRQVSHLSDYIEQVYENTEEIQNLEQVQIFYSSQEIPFFLYFASPELFAFKMYVYALAYWNLQYISDKKFRIDFVTPEITNKATKISSMYNMLPSRELWNIGMVDNTLSQIEYLATVDQFERKEDALQLCDALSDLMDHARNMAARGKKFSPNSPVDSPGQSFNLYINEFSRTNDTILITSSDSKMLFTTFGTPNFLRTSDAKLCKQIEEWFDSITSRSTSISFHSTKDRERLFNHLAKRIRETREKVERIFYP